MHLFSERTVTILKSNSPVVGSVHHMYTTANVFIYLIKLYLICHKIHTHTWWLNMACRAEIQRWFEFFNKDNPSKQPYLTATRGGGAAVPTHPPVLFIWHYIFESSTFDSFNVTLHRTPGVTWQTSEDQGQPPCDQCHAPNRGCLAQVGGSHQGLVIQGPTEQAHARHQEGPRLEEDQLI